MLVYRDGGRHVDCRAALARLRVAAAEMPGSRDGALNLLIQAGEFESGVADARAPEKDHLDPASSALRDLTSAAATAWLGHLEDAAGDPRAESISERLDALDNLALPPAIELRVSEGYAYYGLFPETYVASARRFATATAPTRIHAIGIRSIGTSLCSVVGATLQRGGCAVTTSTVRPRGHPFQRELKIDHSLADAYKSEAARGAVFLVVDEGPGLSGSSFAAVATYLRSLGIPASRIALFPSWEADPGALRSESARRVWIEHPRYCAIPDPRLTPEKVFGIHTATVDFSAGRWRSTIFPPHAPEVPAVQPQHERWKILVPSAARTIRFAGVGAYGAAVARRAARLAELGLAESPGPLRSGFLDLPFVAGSPLSRCEGVDDAAAIGTYIGRVAGAFATGEGADTSTLQQMIETNLRGITPGLQLDSVPETPAVALDGRMLAHEWIRTKHGLAKVDALDHHAGHFLPGPQSPAWDLAGAEIELRMDVTSARAMLDAFERTSRDRTARPSLPFYRLAYAAFRFGYATLAAETLSGTDDGARFERAAAFYSQCALKATACFNVSAKSPLKHTARSSMNT